MVFSNRTFNACRQLMIQFFIRPGTVKHKRTAVFNAAKQIKTFYIRLTVTSNIVRRINQVRHIDRFRTETQVRYRYAARFFGIISKVCLCIQVRMVTDNLDSRFMQAVRPVVSKGILSARGKERFVTSSTIPIVKPCIG